MAVDHLLQYWQQALKQPRGLRVKVSDRTLFRQQLYRARDGADDKAEYMGIAVMFPKNPKDEVWLVHKSLSDE